MNQAQVPASPMRRLARWVWPWGNPLARPADWAQTALLTTVVVLGLLLVPVALVLGSETYAGQTRVAEEQSRTRHPTTATLLADVPPAGIGVQGTVVAGTSAVQARWQSPDGATKVGQIQAPDGLLAGATVPIWLDPAGNPIDRPISPLDPAGAGITLATLTLLGGFALLGGLYFGGRFALDRYRYAAWQREWTEVEPAWSHGQP
jgi:hypothetical protein